jgi:hypothetical protein
MGSIVKGKCYNCGYETKDLYYGGGFMNFITCCDYPVLDKITKEIIVANIMEREAVIKQNPNLVFYDEKSLSDKKLRNRDHYHEWGEYKLYNNGYLCPKCDHFSLGFEMSGCWD